MFIQRVDRVGHEPHFLAAELLTLVQIRVEWTARLIFNSFGSSLWMMPSSEHCATDNVYWKHFSDGSRKHLHAYHCDEHEFQTTTLDDPQIFSILKFLQSEVVYYFAPSEKPYPGNWIISNIIYE
ncbi:Uncharacterized protein Fot_26405 [Forsythia ovata]|uniref:Uncharacterized protein n=1 Tax=Forsythia ovata TaxID=205694 RepID=A0ABD1UBV7_9LAMI